MLEVHMVGVDTNPRDTPPPPPQLATRTDRACERERVWRTTPISARRCSFLAAENLRASPRLIVTHQTAVR